MSKQECQAIIAALSGSYQLMTQLLYGSGLRLSECLRLHIKDVDFAQNHLIVRSGKGDNRVTLLPNSLKPALTTHLHRVELQHHADLKQGYGQVYLPNALELLPGKTKRVDLEVKSSGVNEVVDQVEIVISIVTGVLVK